MASSAQRASRKQRERKILLDLLRELRKQKGLTQDQMAKAIGAKQAFVSKYETGERRLDFLDLVAICEVLSLSIVKFAERFETARKGRWSLAVELEAPNSSPDAFIFPNTDGGFMDSGNYQDQRWLRWRWNFGSSKLNFQVLRRTMATLAQGKGSAKDTKLSSLWPASREKGRGCSSRPAWCPCRHHQPADQDVVQAVAWDGVERPAPAFSGAAETVLAVTYENVEGCASTVKHCKDVQG
jgi:transcriptional regulator with XRE-family HTH domain